MNYSVKKEVSQSTPTAFSPAIDENELRAADEYMVNVYKSLAQMPPAIRSRVVMDLRAQLMALHDEEKTQIEKQLENKSAELEWLREEVRY